MGGQWHDRARPGDRGRGGGDRLRPAGGQCSRRRLRRGRPGALLLVAVLLSGGRKLTAAQRRYLTWAGASAAVWAVAAAATLVFTLSDLFGQPVGGVISPAVVADFVATDAQGRGESYAGYGEPP